MPKTNADSDADDVVVGNRTRCWYCCEISRAKSSSSTEYQTGSYFVCDDEVEQQEEEQVDRRPGGRNIDGGKAERSKEKEQNRDELGQHDGSVEWTSNVGSESLERMTWS